MLAYETRGAGARPVLLLHGFLGSRRNLASLARRWHERDPTVRLVLADLTGHGASPPLPPGANLDTLGRDVADLAERLKLDPPVPIVGHSLGGRVALAARALAPGRFGPVTLLDIAPGPIPPLATELDRVLAALLAAPARTESRDELRSFFGERGLGAHLTDWILMNLAPAEDGGVGWRIDRQALAALHSRTRGLDLWPLVEQSETPTRCIRGGRSPFVSELDAARLVRFGVRVDTLADAGHFLHIDEQDELLSLLAASD